MSHWNEVAWKYKRLDTFRNSRNGDHILTISSSDKTNILVYFNKIYHWLGLHGQGSMALALYYFIQFTLFVLITLFLDPFLPILGRLWTFKLTCEYGSIHLHKKTWILDPRCLEVGDIFLTITRHDLARQMHVEPLFGLPNLANWLHFWTTISWPVVTLISNQFLSNGDTFQ